MSTLPTHFAKGNDPYESIEWVDRDAIIGDPEDPVFSQDAVEFPSTWSQRAVNIVASKYFYGSGGTREDSLKTLIDRVTNAIASFGLAEGYFGHVTALDEPGQQHMDLSPRQRRDVFEDELRYILVNQIAAFNSPVWFNVGVKGVAQQSSACFINRVEDTIDSILELSMAEGKIFSRGSGAGVNISRLRGEGEPLSGGGTSSGPISFMKGLDAQAGVIKSGGVTRRAAKMVLMDVDHPDIMKFIRCKQDEERKALALIDAGYSADIDGEAYGSIYFQNANHSVRLSDQFMEQRQAEEGIICAPWYATRRTDDEYVEIGSAENIFREIATVAHACGDPGVQYSDTINEWHTCKNTDKIYGSNPCSEFVFLDNTSCNLASINVLKFWDGETFDWRSLRHTVEILITAQDILVGYSDYPTDEITEMTADTRPLGLGIANLGALLMTMGMPYDSDEARGLGASIMAVVTGHAYFQSAQIARIKDPFALYEANREPMLGVIAMHKDAAYELAHRINLRRDDTSDFWIEIVEEVETVWTTAYLYGEEYGYRNAQVTVCAPTGTISFMMDCETTGIEPLLAPKTTKTLVGGGTIEQDAECYIEARAKLDARPISDFDPILATALGVNCLTPAAHLDMVAALQPFVSGAISKTINMPHDATVAQVEKVYLDAWKKGVKCVAVYRDGSKGSQPITATQAKDLTATFGVSNIAAAEGDDAFKNDPPIRGPLGNEPVITKGTGDTITAYARLLIQDPPVIKETHAKAEYVNPLTSMKVHQVARALGVPARQKLPRRREAVIHKFDIGGHEGYLTVGLFANGEVAEIFVNMAKEGSTISGLLGSWALTISMALQYGVPLSVLITKHSYVRYEPSGFTGDSQVPSAYSITDYIMRWIAASAASFKEGKDQGKVPEQYPTSSPEPMISSPSPVTPSPVTAPSNLLGSGNVCQNCQGILIVQGGCHVCTTCAESNGCG